VRGPGAEGADDVLKKSPTNATVATLGTFLHSHRLLEDLKLPRMREGDFHPQLCSCRKRTFPELLEVILALSAVEVNTPEDLRFSGRDLRDVLLTTKHFLPRRSRFGTSKTLGEKPELRSFVVKTLRKSFPRFLFR